MRVIVITNPAPKAIEKLITISLDDFVIVVDGALDDVYKKILKIDLVVGDFDSVKNKKILKNYQTLKLPSKKDVTDTYQAIKEAFKLSNNIIMLGGIKGDRIDHFIANFTLFNEYPNLIIMDDNTNMFLLNEGSHVITKTKYTSFFAKDEALISLYGFKYNLNNYLLKPYDALGISNEVIKAYGEINISKGSVFVIQIKSQN